MNTTSDTKIALSGVSSSGQPLGSFYWKRADTISALLIAAVLIVAYYPMVFFGKIPMDRQTLTLYYPVLANFSELGLWNPWQLSGSSMIADSSAALFYPPNWIFFILPANIAFVLSTLGHYYLAAIGMYLLARFCRLTTMAALVAAFVFCLGGYMSSRLLMRPLLLSASWFPIIFLCYLYGHYRRMFAGYLMAGVFMGIQILSGTCHNAVYTIIAFAFFTLYRVIISAFFFRHWRTCARITSFYLLFVIVGLLLAAVVILPALELLPHTVRAYFSFDEVTLNSLPWRMLPDVFVGSSHYQLRDMEHFLETNTYIGVLGAWLVLFALIGHWRKGIFWFFTGLLLISIIFATGRNSYLYRFVYYFPYMAAIGVPEFGKFFDSPSRFLGLGAFALAILAGYGIDTLVLASGRDAKGRLSAKGKAIVGILGAGCLIWLALLLDMVFRLGGDFYSVFLSPTIKSPHFAYANFSLFTLIFGLCTITFLLGFMRRRTFQALLLIALVADLLHSGSQVEVEYSSPGDIYYENNYPPVSIRFIQERGESTLRVASVDVLRTNTGNIKYTRYKAMLTPNLARLYKVPDVSGYSPTLLKRYSDLLQVTTGLTPARPPMKEIVLRSVNSPMLDILRVGYVIGEVNEKLVFSGLMELHEQERRVLKLDLEQPCTQLRFHSAMTHGVGIQQGTQVGSLLLRDAAGDELAFPLRAGIETADMFVEISHGHHPTSRQRSWSSVVLGRKLRIHDYVYTLPFPDTFLPVELEITNTSEAQLNIYGVALKEQGTGRFEQEFLSVHDKVYRNTTAMPGAWWVHKVHVEHVPEKILGLIESNMLPGGEQIDYRNIAFIENPPANGTASSMLPGGGSVDIEKWEAGHIVLEAESDAAGLLVFSEVNCPGWQAWVDGEPVEIIPANYILRGLSLSAGKHRIEMHYRPKSFYFGLTASLLTVAFVVLRFLRFRRRFPENSYADIQQEIGR